MRDAPWGWIGAGVAALVALLATTVLPAIHNEQLRQERRFQAWMVPGARCRRVGSTDGLPRLAQTFEVDGVRIARQQGHLTCREIRDHGPPMLACHLTSPGIFLVSRGQASAAFDAGPGGPAAVYIGQSETSCVRNFNPALFSVSNDRPYDGPT